jgi:asparaginyl-tRNA synthetase
MKTKMDIDTVFAYRELSIRDPDVTAIMNLKSIIAQATRNFFLEKGFTEIFTPFILTASTEGGAEQFKLDYFGQPAVLAQSCQFYKQAALSSHDKVFGLLPSWRAEKSHTTKHMTEFWQIENEISFGTDKEIMQVQEDLIKFIFKSVTNEGSDYLAQLNREISIPKIPFKKIPFKDAKQMILDLGVEEDLNEDFGANGESILSKSLKEPFFITEFPVSLRGMYYAANPNDPQITRSLDLMAPDGFGELSSGGQRVADYKILEERITKQGFELSNFEWYLRMFRFGMPPHAGFGLGFERLIRWIANLSHIREASLFPRTPDIYSP